MSSGSQLLKVLVGVLLLGGEVRASSQNSINYRIIREFLRTHNLKRVAFISPGGNRPLIDSDFRLLVNENFVRFLDYEHPSFASTFEKDFVRFGVVVMTLKQEILDISGSSELFNRDRDWLIFLENVPDRKNKEIIWETFAETNINIDADVTVAIKEDLNSTILLYDIYKVCHLCGSPLQIIQKGFWSPQAGYVEFPEFREPYVKRRKNFNNITVNSAVTITAKPAHLTDKEFLDNIHIYKEFDDMQRKTYHLMLLAEQHWNLTFNVTIRDSWDGILNDIFNRTVEVSMSPLRMTVERLSVVDYSPIIHKESIAFIFRHPAVSSIRNIFLSPLSSTVWWSLLALVALSILLLALLVALERRRTSLITTNSASVLPSGAPPIEMRADWIMLTIWEALCIQGPDPVIFRAPSTRTLIFSVCLFSVLLQQFYAAFIVGSLLMTPPHSITTLNALYNSSLDIGMEDYPFQHEIFKQSGPIGQAIYANRICRADRRTHVLLLRDAVQHIAHGGFAYHTATERAYHSLKSILKDSEFCDLQAIPLYPPILTPVGWRKRWAMREHFAKSILLYRSSGLMQYNDKQWEVSRPDCKLSDSREVQVDMEHFLPALMVLAAAMIISVLALPVEWLIKRLRGQGFAVASAAVNMRASHQEGAIHTTSRN